MKPSHAVAYAENFHGGVIIQWHSKQFVKTINLFCAGNKVFVNFQAQGGVLAPTPLAYALAPVKIFCIRHCAQWPFIRSTYDQAGK